MSERTGLTGELRRLKATQSFARRLFLRYGDHRSEITLDRAKNALDVFISEHPDLRSCDSCAQPAPTGGPIPEPSAA